MLLGRVFIMSSLNETDIIKIFKNNFSTLPHILVGIKSKTGINEDCGVIDLGLDSKVLVVTTDLIGKKTHAPPTMTLKQFGMKSVTVNISDLAAVGAEPLGLVMSLGIPESFSEDDIKELSIGMEEAVSSHGTCVFGGDVNKADDLIIAGTAIGMTTKEKLMARQGANKGDLVVISGNLGLAASGFAILNNERNDLIESYPKSIKAALEPVAKLELGVKLAQSRAVTSIGDISDGLGKELNKIRAASNVGFDIEESSLPIHPELEKISEELNIDKYELIFHVGEDFELVFTVKEDEYWKIERIEKELNEEFAIIGRVKEKGNGVKFITLDKKTIFIKEKGWDQFTSSV